MDFSILYAIQNIRTPILDEIIVFITNACGSKAQIWIYLGIVLCLFKKTRKMGLSVLLSYYMVWIIGQDILKDIIARVRPCNIDETIELLVSRPTSYSCPSTHSGLAFAMATSIYSFDKYAGKISIICALIIAFSRMYLFVHFPSDVLLGSILGIISGIVCAKLIKYIYKKVKK